MSHCGRCPPHMAMIVEPTATTQTDRPPKWRRISVEYPGHRHRHELQSIIGSFQYGWRSTRMPTNLLPRRSTRPATHIWISAVVTEGTTSRAGRASTCSFGNRGTLCSPIPTGLKSIEAFQASLRTFLHRFGRKASCQCHRHRSSLERGFRWAP